ncbi:MAG: tipN [Asticcacaulis sp.]
MKSRIRPPLTPLNLSSSEIRTDSGNDTHPDADTEAQLAAEQASASDDDLDIPSPQLQTEAYAEGPAVTLTPPPEPSPPVMQEETPEPVPVTKAAPALKARPDGILKVSGGSGGLFWGGTIFVSLLWALSLTAFVLGAETDLNAFTTEPFRLVILGALALFPIGLIVATAVALRHAAALSQEARRTAALADAMIAPATVAASETSQLVDSLRQQVEQAVRAVRMAHNDLSELSQRLKSETDTLNEAAGLARSTTTSITDALGHERTAITALGEILDKQAHSVIDAVDRQARMVADASDLAQTQLQEAEAALAARAADLTTAANDAQESVRVIAEDLGRQTLRLETAGTGVTDQIRTVEEGLSQQRAGLVSAALSLRADQEDFAVHLENQRAQLAEALNVTRTATVELGETSSRGVDVLRDLVLHAQAQFRQVLTGAESERTAFETRIHSTLSNISLMAADARDEMVSETQRALEQLHQAASDARTAADQAAASAQTRVDRLNESLFEAGKKAEDVFDSRMASARRLIEDSVELIDDAGDKAAQRLDDSFAHARNAIAQVDAALSEINARVDDLPQQSRTRLEEIRRSVEDGLMAMTDAARKAAEETEAVDQVFQERVKRNYEMLTEAVRLMGVVGGQPQPSAPSASNPYVERFDRTRDPIRPARVRTEPLRPDTASDRQTNDRSAPLTPARKTRPERPLERPADRQSVQDGWSWRDLLNGMEGRENPPPTARETSRETPRNEPAKTPPSDPQAESYESLDDLLVAEVTAMGVDTHSLLNRTRLSEIIAAIVADDNEGARLVIRRVAPAAIRRLSRRLTTDPTLREQVNEFVGALDRQINIALLTPDAQAALTELLGNPAGRTYLMFDAAISDLI